MQEIISLPRPKTNFIANLETANKRRAVRYNCGELLAGRPTKIMYKGRNLDFDDVAFETSLHPKFVPALQACANGNSATLQDLTRRVAQYLICDYLFEGEQSDLGFAP
jgi:hypothetical protein